MHLATFKTADAGKLIAHDERAIGERDHIDRDGIVYDLAVNRTVTPLEKYHELIQDLELGARSKPLASFMITKPDAVPPAMSRRFFEATYRFLAAQVGEDNIVEAYVHLDEPGARDHMAFKFVPIVDIPEMTNDKSRPLCWTAKDEKKNPAHKAGEQKRDSKGTLRWERIPKLDADGQPVMRHTAVASKMFPKARLTELHPALENYLCKELGMEKVGIVLDEGDERKKLSKLSHDDYVRVTAAIDEATERLESVQQREADARAEVAELDRAIEAIEAGHTGIGEAFGSKDAAERIERENRELEGRELALESENQDLRDRARRLERDAVPNRADLSRREEEVRNLQARRAASEGEIGRIGKVCSSISRALKSGHAELITVLTALVRTDGLRHEDHPRAWMAQTMPAFLDKIADIKVEPRGKAKIYRSIAKVETRLAKWREAVKFGIKIKRPETFDKLTNRLSALEERTPEAIAEERNYSAMRFINGPAASIANARGPEKEKYIERLERIASDGGLYKRTQDAAKSRIGWIKRGAPSGSPVQAAGSFNPSPARRPQAEPGIERTHDRGAR